jgi:hypothetical protein
MVYRYYLQPGKIYSDAGGFLFGRGGLARMCGRGVCRRWCEDEGHGGQARMCRRWCEDEGHGGQARMCKI